MKKPTLTIGIPAYNEEANIDHLLRALLADTSKRVAIKEIIVVSDGSTDATVARARSIRDRRIRVLDRRVRRGLSETENEIVRRAKGDVLILLDADVIPMQKNFLDSITMPIRVDQSIGCVGAETIPLPPRNLFERVIANSHYMKRHLYRQIGRGHNVYLCHGRGRAFSRRLYRQLHWPDNCPEDAYSYFVCKSLGLKFVYAANAGVYFRSPTVLPEHALQSTRFTAGIRRLKGLFNPDFVRREYSIPKSLLLKTLILYLYRNPFSTPVYLVLTLYVRFAFSDATIYRSRFKVASSSKRVVLYKGQKLSRV